MAEPDALTDLLSAFPDLVLHVDRDGRVTDHARTDPRIVAAFEAVSPRYMRRLMETSESQRFWFSVDLERRLTEYEARLVSFGGAALAIVRDVTDQLRTEEELQLFLGITLTLAEAEDFETAMAQVLRLVCEATGWAAGVGWTTDDIDSRLFCRGSWTATPEYERFAVTARQALLQRGEGAPGRVWEERKPVVIRDLASDTSGSSTLVSAALSASLTSTVAVPVLAEDEVVAVLQFWAPVPRDIDERLLTIGFAIAAQLGTAVKRRRREERLRLLDSAVSQANEAIIIASTAASPDGPRIVYVSPHFTRLTGYQAHEVLGRGLDLLCGPATPMERVRELRESLRQGHEIVFESVNYRKDGSPIEVEWRGAPVREADGRVTRFIAILHDITPRRQLIQLQESLRRSETMSALGAVTAGVAHEVRNPLHAITTTLDAFERRAGASPQWEPHLRVLRGEVGRLSDLMRDLLEYGKPTTQQFFPGAIAEVVRNALSACAAPAERGGVELHCSDLALLPDIEMDSGRMLQVFHNIVLNALQHCKSGGVVSIGAELVEERGQSFVDCTVSDDGPGFKPEDLPHVFEPFYTRRRGGTGLGLAIVERIVDAHGGEVSVANGPHGGGRVTVRLPLERRS